MSTILGIETDTGEEIPFWFTKTDTRSLKIQLWDVYYGSTTNEISRLFNHFNLPLKPFTNIVGGEGETLENFMSRDPDDKERAGYWYEEQERREAAWQSPIDLINTIKPLLIAIDQNPNVYSELKITDTYFLDGYFYQDMIDLKIMLEWTLGKGIGKVRITES